MTDGSATTLTIRGGGGELVAYGAELVELSERFYRALFAGTLIFAGMASVAAVALLPFRRSVPGVGLPITVIVTVLLALLTPVAVRHVGLVYRVLRQHRRVELVLVVLAAALIAYPLRSELWWPSCALVMLVAIIAPLRRTLAYCLAVLLTNLIAHVIAGDLHDIPAEAILGLWVGFPFWASTFSVISDQFAAHILRLQTAPPPRRATAPRRVTAWTTPDRPPEEDVSDIAPADAPEPRPDSAMSRLTARQLQVTALLVDGLRYREVAACLSITEKQVHRHVANAIARAGVRTANELVAVAVAEGLAPPRPARS